jgi:dTDP-4-dehydrorhamnose 3,5-epimerase-like enzyme
VPSATEMQFRAFEDVNGVLCVYEGGQGVPFEIRRVFTISAKAGDIRGEHAHKKCTQLLVCLSGQVRVVCDSGSAVTSHLLDSCSAGLLIPPRVWASEEYLTDGAVLMVLCDRTYEADDYIRDYNVFKDSLRD